MAEEKQPDAPPLGRPHDYTPDGAAPAVRKGPAAERPGFFRGARVNSKRPATDKG